MYIGVHMLWYQKCKILQALIKPVYVNTDTESLLNKEADFFWLTGS
jgi:hypothetical protein